MHRCALVVVAGFMQLDAISAALPHGFDSIRISTVRKMQGICHLNDKR